MKKVLILLFCLLPALGAVAQTIYKEQVRVENANISRSPDNTLTIVVDLVMQKNLKISSNHVATLTPFLEANGHKKLLAPIVLYGRKRGVIDRRGNKIPENAYAVLYHKRETEQKVSYAQQMPYELWMQHAELKVNVDLCGCCDLVEESTGDLITKADIAPLKIQPSIAYITPQAEVVKHRAVEGKAYLDFRVNKMNIDTEYRRNATELANIRATIDTVRNDDMTQLTGITIHGYASPEGGYANNARLAQGRTQALADYVTGYYKFDTKLILSESTPEDWDGFRKYVEKSSMDKKDEILSLMDDLRMNIDTRERNIARLVGPAVYKKEMLEECYPALRHSDYTVSYTVRSFDLQEAKEYMDKRPQLLSLQECFMVAQSYQPGSEEFNKAFLTAVTMYPEDPIANLNAAAMELEKKNLATAKKYLAKADPKHGATLNNLGIIAMIEDDVEAAVQYFNQAKAVGYAKEAEANLKELAQKRTFPTE